MKMELGWAYAEKKGKLPLPYSADTDIGGDKEKVALPKTTWNISV